jgi:hypothetical protein
MEIPVGSVDEQKSDQQRFLEHLEKATAIVRSWPEWKQSVLSSIGFPKPAETNESPAKANNPNNLSAKGLKGMLDIAAMALSAPVKVEIMWPEAEYESVVVDDVVFCLPEFTKIRTTSGIKKVKCWGVYIAPGRLKTNNLHLEESLIQEFRATNNEAAVFEILAIISEQRINSLLNNSPPPWTIDLRWR